MISCNEDRLHSEKHDIEVDDKCSETRSSLTGTCPDGGLRAWSVVLGSLLVQFSCSGYVCSYGVFQDYYTRVYMTNYSASAISWIGSVAPFLMLMMGLLSGRLYDRGYCMILLYSGALIVSLALFMLSFTKPNQYYLAFICQGLGLGLGGGMIYIPSQAVVSQYFDKRQPMALAIVLSGVSFGAILTPIMINNLLETANLSFATSTRIHAGLTTVALILACVLIRPRLPPPNMHVNLFACLKKLSKDRLYTITIGVFLFFGLGLFFPIFFLQLAATTHGLSNEFAFYSLVILNGCACAGSFICAFVSQKIRADYLTIYSAIGCSVVCFAFAAVGSATSVVLIGVVYGVSYGILISILTPLASLVNDEPKELGFRLGIAYAFAGVAELAGPPIMGALLTGYHWWRPALFAGMAMLACTACVIRVAFILRGRNSA
ncbi:hypothetical protein D9756_010121 [Leucocoprinus leucothites]|uniref:MFS general substrate transporter n=1 Tax=Leucocoprinus leucothites TaxID=201217 RepID=A0A8H5CUP4_9AGAR|nr:hypothetical protein D9756_010121 [Leucoagaricus leucothites]